MYMFCYTRSTVPPGPHTRSASPCFAARVHPLRAAPSYYCFQCGCSEGIRTSNPSGHTRGYARVCANQNSAREHRAVIL